MTHKEVITLQIFLARDKKIYPEASVSGFFGSATEKAVMRFQEKYSITRKGVVGYGQVGPKTRTKVNELLNL